MVNKFIKHIGKNFGNPKGIIGIIMTKIMNIMNQKHYSAVLDNIELEPNNIILDIGFGNGYLINKLFKKNIPITIYDIEISSDMMNKVSKKNKQNINDGKLKLLLENINDTSFETNTFDKICTVNTIYFWNDYEKCFSEIKRILKPNGIFLNNFYSKEFLENIIYTKYGFNKYTVEEIVKMTEKNGLKIIKTIEIKKGHSYCIISEK
jgi:ubiquinone/menaquinone biosynthesis C-methylase UbiE